ncbi:MAG TPA: phosphotransferase [Verrucomicrobiae bacterium]|nr:phosphotransferase [Verrucomicrobiae bacterium]
MVKIVPLPHQSMHEVAAVEIAQNGNLVRFFAKGDLANYGGPQRLETEEYVLKSIAPEIWRANPRTRCPQVLAFFPERKLLLLEMVEGKSLKELLFDVGRNHSNLPDLLALSGEWLGRFHAATQCEQANPFEWLEGSFAEAKVQDVFRNCGVAELYPALATLLQRFRLDYPDFRRPLCRIHSEFTPLHVLVKDDSIYVIDFGSSRVGFGYEDVATFTTFFDTLLPWRAIAGSMRLPLSQQKDIFRESYFAHRQMTFGVPDNIVMRFAYLQAMAHHESCRETIPVSPAAAIYATAGRAWVRRRFAGLARRELAYLRQLVSAPPVWQLDYTSPVVQ